MHKTKASTHAGKPKKHNHDMDKVKIKRVKRNTKKPTTGEKVLGAVGLASTLLGGASAIAPKTQNTQIVRTQTEESPKSSSIKNALKSIFGIEEAHAYSDEEGQEETTTGVSEMVPEDTFMNETVTTEIVKPEGEVSEPIITEEVSLPEDTSAEKTELTPAGTFTTNETVNTEEPAEIRNIAIPTGVVDDVVKKPEAVQPDSGFVTNNTQIPVATESPVTQAAEQSGENLGLDVWTNKTTGEQSAYVSGYGIVTFNPSTGSYVSQNGQQVNDANVVTSFAQPGSVQTIPGTESTGQQDNTVVLNTREVVNQTTNNNTGFIPSGTRTATAIEQMNQINTPTPTPAPFTPTYIQGVTVNNSNDGSSQSQNSNQYATLETAQYYAKLLGGTVEAVSYDSGPFSLSAPQYQIRVGDTLLNAGLVANTFQKNGEQQGMIQIKTDIATSSGQAAPTWNQVADTLNAGGTVYGVKNAPPASAIPTPSSPTIQTTPSTGTSGTATGSNAWIAADTAYWSSQPAAVQKLQSIEDLEQRKAYAEQLAKQGYTIDVPIMVWQWSPTKTTQLRQDYGYTWVPSALQENVQIAPGLSVPGSNLKPYDPNNAPAGSIKVVSTGAAYVPATGNVTGSNTTNTNTNQTGSGINTGNTNITAPVSTAPVASNVVVTQVLAGSQFNQLSPYNTQIKTGDYIELKGSGFEEVKSVSLVVGGTETIMSTVKTGSSIQLRIPSISATNGAAISVKLTLKNNSVKSISTVLKFTTASAQGKDVTVNVPAPSESSVEVLHTETKSIPEASAVSSWQTVSQDTPAPTPTTLHSNVRANDVPLVTTPTQTSQNSIQTETVAVKAPVIDKVELVSFSTPADQTPSENVLTKNESSIPFFNNGVISSVTPAKASTANPVDTTPGAYNPTSPVIQEGSRVEASSNNLVELLQTQVANLQDRIHTLEAKLSEEDKPAPVLVNQIAELKTQAAELQQTVSNVSDWTPVTSSIAMPKFGPEVAVQENEVPIAQNTTYIVKKGDTLWSIAKRVYGEGRKWRKILSANTKVIKDPNSLKMGMELTIPKIDS